MGTSLVLSVFVLAAWGVSTVRPVVWQWSDGKRVRVCQLYSGRIALQYPAIPSDEPTGLEVYRFRRVSLADRFRLGYPEVRASLRNNVKYLIIPLWIPLVTLAVLTVILWSRARCPPRGCCQTCGYNLTGNTTGVCPECGKTV
jgi:hypothetical protein